MKQNHQHTAGDRTPYTYVVLFPSLNQLYYGVRYARNCHPSELGVDYKSSSRHVKRLLEIHNDAIFIVRKIFADIESATVWETRVLKRMNAARHNSFLNKHNNCLFPLDNRGSKNPMFGLPGTMLGRKHTQETLKKMRDTKLGNTWNAGKQNSETSKQKCREAQLGSKSHYFNGYYHTPLGRFESTRACASALKLDRRLFTTWCKHCDTIISKRSIAKSSWLKPEHVGKTYRELGFWFEPILP